MTTMKRTIVGIVSALLLLSVVMAGSAAATGEYSGSSYFYAGDSFTTGAWNGGDTVNISINPRGGNGIIVVNYSVLKEDKIVPADVLKELGFKPYDLEGYFQSGWNTDQEDFSVKYDMSEEIEVTDNLTFYAVWAHGGTTNVTLYNQATFSFVIPSDVILSNELDGKVGANVTIIPGSVKEEGKDIIMRVNTSGFEQGTYMSQKLYPIFSVMLNGAPISTKTKDNSADYTLRTYDTAEDFYKNIVKKLVYGEQNKDTDKGYGSTSHNNIVIGYTKDDTDPQVTDYLAFMTDRLPTKAGTYTGTLTFTVGIEQPQEP